MPRYDVFHHATAVMVTTVEADSLEEALAKAQDWNVPNEFETVDIIPDKSTPWWAEPNQEAAP